MEWERKAQELENYFEVTFGKDNQRIGFFEFLETIKEQECLSLLMEWLPQKYELPKGIHGYLHALRVMIYAFYMASLLGCTKCEIQLLLCAAKYHDIGRKDDSEDVLHGSYSAEWIINHVSNMDEMEKQIVCFLVEAHSCPDKMAEKIMERWQLPDSARGILLATILKDADALDRYRLHMRALNQGFLRNDVAKKLMKAAFVFHHYVLERWLIENKPLVLYHTTFSDKLLFLKPFTNWDMYGEHSGEWVFATERLQNAIQYFLHGEKMFLYSFKYEDGIYVMVPNKEKVENILRMDNIWLYKLNSEQFVPVISNGGQFDDEWVSLSQIELAENCERKKIGWKEVKENNIHILYPSKENEYPFYRKLIHEVQGNQQKINLLRYWLYNRYLFEFDGGNI